MSSTNDNAAAEKEEKELTPYRPSEWPLETFQEKIRDPKFAEFAYTAHTVDAVDVKANEFFEKVIEKIPKTIQRLNIWGGADEFNHGSNSKDVAYGALTVQNVFRNEEMFKSTVRAILLGEAVGYDVSIKRLTECGTYLNEIGHYDEPDVIKKTEEGFLIEVAIQLYYQAVYVTDQHESTQTKLEQEWGESHHSKNKEAFQKILSHMPKDIHQIPSEQALFELMSPTGDKLPKQIARRFFRKNILQILRTPNIPLSASTFMDRVHPVWLEERFISNGLTLTEHRALQYYFYGIQQRFRERLTFNGEELVANTEQNCIKRKYQWLKMLENNFKDALAKGDAKEAVDYSGNYGWYDPNDDANTATTTTKEVLDNLGNNDIHSKMMKQWLDKPSSTTNDDESSRPTPPRPPVGNLLLGIQKKASG